MKICTMSESCDRGHSECCCECKEAETCVGRCSVIEKGEHGACDFLEVKEEGGAVRTTGIVNKVNDQGRFAVPRVVLKGMGMNAGDAVEILVDHENETILIRKYTPSVRMELREELAEAKVEEKA